MSINGISSSNYSTYYNQGIQNQIQQFQQEFQQLGSDLQSGNLSAAQQDFASLQNLSPQQSSSAQSNNPIAQTFNQLAQDLQSGNLQAAQQDYTNLQQDFQNRAHGHPHHHHGGGSSENNTISQEMQQLGQALQSGNLSGAQQAYNTLLQTFQQSGPSTVTAQTSQPATNGVSVNA